MATLLKDQKRGRGRRRQKVSATFTKAKVIIDLMSPGIWKAGLRRITLRKPTTGLGRSGRSAGYGGGNGTVNVSLGAIDTSGSLGSCHPRGNGYGNHKRFKKATRERLAESHSPVPSISAAEEDAEEALNREMSRVSTSDDSDLN